MKRDNWLLWLGGIILFLVIPFGGVATVVVMAIGKAKQDFLKAVKDSARRYLDSNYSDWSTSQREKAASIIASQAALESGYGGTKAYKLGFNFGNMSKGSWKGETIPGGDLEYDAQGNVKKIAQEWRKYGSLDEAMTDFFRWCKQWKDGSVIAALKSGNPNNFAYALREKKYYTAPLAEYQAGIAKVLVNAERVT